MLFVVKVHPRQLACTAILTQQIAKIAVLSVEDDADANGHGVLFDAH